MIKEIFALFSVILFWGYETGNILFSIILLIFLILPYIIKSKLKFSFKLFKFASLISYFLLFMVIYYYMSNNSLFFFGGILKWSPLILLPIIALENYSKEKKTPIKALTIFLDDDKTKLKVLFYYILLTVLATSSGKITIIYYPFIGAFFGAILQYIRVKRYSLIKGALSLFILFITAFIVQNGASSLHKKVVDSLVNFLMGIDNDNINISKSSTRIGSIGDLKLSNKIMYRLKADKKEYPLYLREATYTKYFNGDWVAPKSKFSDIKNSLCKKVEINNTNLRKIFTAELIGEFKKQSTLPLATRTINILKKNNENFSKNKLIVIKREGKEANSIKFYYYKDKISCDKKMDLNDLKTPKNELKYIKLFIKKHNLSSKIPVIEVLKKLDSIFYSEFGYSLKLKKSKKIKSPLGNFLLESKAGHCEYFATASTLILRELGIPARYTVGYSVQEYSNLGDVFIIRQRHAHAWVRVYVNNQWYNYDTTPPSWNKIENSGFSIFYVISDFLSYLEYKFISFGILTYVKEHLEYFIAFLIFIFLMLRYRNKKNRKKDASTGSATYRKSKFLKKIDKIIKKKGLIRNKKIPIKIWLNSLSKTEKDIIKYHELNEIIRLYYIYRFSDENLPKKRLKIIYKKIKIWKRL